MGTMQDYLDRLPDGIASYPEVRVKAAFLHSRLARLPSHVAQKMLPAEVRTLIASPVPSSFFIPVVPVFALNHAILDSFDDVRAYLDFSAEHNRVSLNSALYRVLFAMASPKMVLKRAASTWARIHDGINLETELGEGNTVTNVVTFPPHLAFPEILMTWQEAFAYTLGLSGGKEATVEIVEQSSTSVVYSGRWQ